MNELPHGLGFRQKPDPRDAEYLLSKIVRAPSTIPVSKSWRRGTTLDQGRTSSCVGHACWQFQASEPIFNAPTMTPWEIYDEARKNDEWDDNDSEDAGTSIRAGLETLRRHGIIKGFYWADSAAQVIDYLLRFGPIIFGTDWTEDMFNPDDNGVIRPTGKSVGGHAWFAHAARWNLATGSGRITGLTSWGKDFGYNGEFEISIADIDELFKRGGVAAAVLEK